MAKKGKIENLKPFEPGHDPRRNLKGRPPGVVSSINAELDEMGYEKVTKSQVEEAYLRMVNLPIRMLAAIASKNISYKDEDGNIVYLEEGDRYPALYRLVAKELLGRNGAYYLENMLNRSIGKPQQSVDVTTQGEKITQTGFDLNKLTDDELRILADIQSKCRVGEA